MKKSAQWDANTACWL